MAVGISITFASFFCIRKQKYVDDNFEKVPTDSFKTDDSESEMNNDHVENINKQIQEVEQQ